MRNQERNLEWVTMLELEDHVTEELRVETWIEGIIDQREREREDLRRGRSHPSVDDCYNKT